MNYGLIEDQILNISEFLVAKLLPTSTKLKEEYQKGEGGIFVGYDSNSKAYRIDVKGKNVTIAKTVKFLEDSTRTLKYTYFRRKNGYCRHQY